MLIDFRQLFPRWNIKPKGILHLGAHEGQEAAVYEQLGIKDVFWIEANPEIYERLQVTMSKYERHRSMLCAVGDENKQVTFHLSSNGGQSSSVLELGTHKIQHPDVTYVEDITVPMVRLDQYFEVINFFDDLDFLSCDLQGFELNAMRGMGKHLNQFKWIYTEVNKAEVYKGCPHVNDLDLFLNGFGFKRVETAHWIGDWTDALYIKKQFI